MQKDIKRAYDLISSVNRTAYDDIFLIANQVLSKNPFTNNFLNRFLLGEEASEAGVLRISYKILLYYIKSICHFLLYTVKFMLCRVASPGGSLPKKGGELILIDEFFVAERICSSGRFQDQFFPGLRAVLEKSGRDYAYLPVFYSSSHSRNPFILVKTLSRLKAERIPLITEFRLLTISDLCRLMLFMAAYPFRMLMFYNRLKPLNREMRLLRREIIDGLDDVTFYPYSRYLVGRALSRIGCDGIKLISWYENQPLSKYLYRGLRDSGTKSVIYGAQLLVYSKNNIGIVPDENELGFGVLPDRIIVNGQYYEAAGSRLNIRVGPSLRYSRIFDLPRRRNDGKDILVVLPHIVSDMENILKTISRAGALAGRIIIKAHPTSPIGRRRDLIPPEAVISDEDIYKLLCTAGIVIGAASGALVEAAALGIPVITVRNPERFDYNNPLPEFGRGVIWEEVAGPAELCDAIKKLEARRAGKQELLQKTADDYKKMFFSEVSEEKIRKAFDI